MKSLLLYDFVGLYLAILCNPYYGYPIASKNEDTCVFLPIYSPMWLILIPMSLIPGRISRFMLCLTVMWMESPEAKR